MSDIEQSVAPVSHNPSNRTQSAPVKSASRMALVVGIAFVILGAKTLWDREAHASALQKTTFEISQQYVTVVKPSAATALRKVTLPGTLMGQTESPIYARSTGYVAHWYKDIGDTVKQGELLATIELRQALGNASLT
jgi:multidrug efflux pump subunit AcrA (membrane-fusion protein)